MRLFGELFLSEIIKKPVSDPKGEIVGRVKDVIVVNGDPLPEGFSSNQWCYVTGCPHLHAGSHQ
jgi:hypothetical protein